jgi:hypothetical protein
VAYLANQNSNANVELFTNPGDATSTITNNNRINGDMVTDGDVVDYDWAPDSSRLAYLADEDLVTQFELYTALPDGTDNVVVGGVTGDSKFDVLLGNFVWAPDSSAIAFLVGDTITSLSTTFVDL